MENYFDHIVSERDVTYLQQMIDFIRTKHDNSNISTQLPLKGYLFKPEDSMSKLGQIIYKNMCMQKRNCNMGMEKCNLTGTISPGLIKTRKFDYFGK